MISQKYEDGRSYGVTLENGVQYRRNRVHLRPTLEPPPAFVGESDWDYDEEAEAEPLPPLRRSTRVRKTPDWYRP